MFSKAFKEHSRDQVHTGAYRRTPECNLPVTSVTSPPFSRILGPDRSRRSGNQHTLASQKTISANCQQDTGTRRTRRVGTYVPGTGYM